MDVQRECPLCEKKIADLLKHLRFHHKIDSIDKFDQERIKIANRKSKQIAFAKYVEELKEKKKSGKISAEEYRELITKWGD